MGIFTGDTRKSRIRVGRTAGRSGIEEFLRGKGLWVGLDKSREQLNLKQTELATVKDGLKEVESILSSFE